MRTIDIVKKEIIELDVDAIVVPSNEQLTAESEVSRLVFRNAGYEKLRAACDAIGHCERGEAVITPGFDLQAKYIIHAVPVPRQGVSKSLKLAVDNGCKSIGIPLMEPNWLSDLISCAKFLYEHDEVLIDIVFATTDNKMHKLWRESLLNLDAGRYVVMDAAENAMYNLSERIAGILYDDETFKQQDAMYRLEIDVAERPEKSDILKTEDQDKLIGQILDFMDCCNYGLHMRPYEEIEKEMKDALIHVLNSYGAIWYDLTPQAWGKYRKEKRRSEWWHSIGIVRVQGDTEHWYIFWHAYID